MFLLKTEHICRYRIVNATATLGSVTGTERGREITAKGNADRERGSERERGSVRRRGCGGKKNGRGTGSSGMRKRGQGCVLLEMQERRKMRTN